MVHMLSCGNEFHLQDKKRLRETHLCTTTRFETDVWASRKWIIKSDVTSGTPLEEGFIFNDIVE